MTSLLHELKTSLLTTLLTAILLCGAYPVAVWAIGQVVFSSQASGSLIVTKDGAKAGTSLLGQGFTASNYFHPRPSAAGAAGYDATHSGGSNLGPTSRTLIENVKQRIEDYRKENSLAPYVLIPADAVTTSASGLDPHISPANARLQAARVARERGLSLDQVSRLVEQYTDAPSLGIFGDPGVNVLKLNLALDGRLE